ncbi:unnamed protein product [Heterobilharzia americana]|nr:unnamed protein product [Heterobilharzia americana]CAH8436578.1 unnamed protein product [Heterobilharzia americana]
MKILPTYFVLVCTILTAFSVNGRLEPPEFELPEYPHGHMRHPIDRIPTRNVNYKMPQYDDQLPDFPNYTETNFLDILNAGPYIPLWLINPAYYIVEVMMRTVVYLASS